jgi:aryl-alcohol dehydrogenase-like predicted oxidoreductase
LHPYALNLILNNTQNVKNMQTRKLGYSDLHLTTIGLGTWAMGGGDWQYGWGEQDDRASINSIHMALDQGINWIDTAAVYGLGHAERIVGKAVAGRRDEVIIATKCGRVWDEKIRKIGKRLKADSIKREAEASLQRLNIEVIDLYQIHWPEPDEDIEEAWGAVAKLIKEGKVRYGGVSNFNREQLERVQPIHPVTSLQPPYSMFRREVEDLFDYCAQHEIGIIAYSPMQAGLLTGKFTKERAADLPDNDWRSRNPLFNEPQLSVNLQTVDELAAIARNKGITMAQLSLAWVLRRPEMTSAIVGARNARQIAETAQAGDIRLNEAETAQIEAVLQRREVKIR